MSRLQAGWLAIAMAALAYSMANHPVPISISPLALSVYVALIVWAWFEFFSRDHIMAGYKNRFIRIDFPDLGDDIWVDILNPTMAPADLLQSDIPIETDADGKLVEGSDSRMAEVTYDIVSKLIIRWNVYDILDPSDDPQPMSLPATIDKMKHLPMAVPMRVMEEVGKAMGRTSDDTSKTS